MTQKEPSLRIEEIDREIAKLVEERLDASRRADEGALPTAEREALRHAAHRAADAGEERGDADCGICRLVHR